MSRTRLNDFSRLSVLSRIGGSGLRRDLSRSGILCVGRSRLLLRRLLGGLTENFSCANERIADYLRKRLTLLHHFRKNESRHDPKERIAERRSTAHIEFTVARYHDRWKARGYLDPVTRGLPTQCPPRLPRASSASPLRPTIRGSATQSRP